MTRLYDCVMYNGEEDILQCRLEECEGSPVYRHVIVESPVTHQGKPKPLWFAENKSRFGPWLDKIINVITPVLPESPDPWVRENAQREYTSVGLHDAQPDDLILIADCDEIPNMAALTAMPQQPVNLVQRCVIYAVDWLWPGPMVTSVLVPLSAIKTFSDLRRNGRPTDQIQNAGTHMTWLGGPEAQLAKADMHCHIEFDEAIRADPQGFYEKGTHPWRVWAAGDLIPVDVDETWPRMVYERRCPKSWFRPRGE